MSDVRRDEEDREFDQAVQEAFKDEGLIVSHYVIIVEVLREDGNLELVRFESEGISRHLIMGMLYAAINDYDNEVDDD